MTARQPQSSVHMWQLKAHLPRSPRAIPVSIVGGSILQLWFHMCQAQRMDRGRRPRNTEAAFLRARVGRKKMGERLVGLIGPFQDESNEEQQMFCARRKPGIHTFKRRVSHKQVEEGFQMCNAHIERI